jgi:hypothetical protein
MCPGQKSGTQFEGHKHLRPISAGVQPAQQTLVVREVFPVALGEFVSELLGLGSANILIRRHGARILVIAAFQRRSWCLP